MARALLVLSLLTGCAVHHDDEVKTYRKVYDPPTTQPVHVDPGQKFTLTEALHLANRNQEQLAVQGEIYLQALIAKDREFSAFLPTVSVGPSYSFQDTHGSAHGSRSTNFNVPANGTINLFNGFQDVHRLAFQDATIEQQKQLLLDLQQTVLLDVVQAYYTILTAEQSVEVLTNSLQVQEARVHDIQSRAALGAAKELDVAQQEAQASQTRVTLNQSVADVQNGRNLLAYLVDAPVQGCPLVDDFSPPRDIPSVDQFVEIAEARRQDLRAAEAAMDAARQQCEIAFGEYYPTINLNLTYFLYKDVSPADNVWNGAISAYIPLFTGGQIEADVRNAWSQFRESALTQSNLRRTIDSNVEQACTNLDLARKQLRELQIQVEAARQALYLADQSYLHGNGTLLNRLIAQDTLLSSQLELTKAQFAQKTAYFNVLRVAGNLSLTIEAGTTRPSEQHIRTLATQPATRPESGE